jgi:hypothetical protein
MLKFPLAHYSLSARLKDIAEEGNVIVFQVTLDSVDGKIRLVMQDRDDCTLDYIAVERDTLVRIELIGDQIFFSKDYEGITTKLDLNAFYGGLVYSDYVEKYERYTVLTFSARYNKGGQRGTVHPFNINIDLMQDNGKGKPHWIALTIDPDIKNPPPRRV